MRSSAPQTPQNDERKDNAGSADESNRDAQTQNAVDVQTNKADNSDVVVDSIATANQRDDSLNQEYFGSMVSLRDDIQPIDETAQHRTNQIK